MSSAKIKFPKLKWSLGLAVVLGSVTAHAAPFELSVGSKVSFDGISLSDESSVSPYGAARFITEDRVFAEPTGAVKDYQVCDLSSLDGESPLELEATAVFSVDQRQADPNSLRHLQIYELQEVGGKRHLRVMCRPNTPMEKVIAGFNMKLEK